MENRATRLYQGERTGYVQRALKFDGKGRLTRLTNWSAYDILRWKRRWSPTRESRKRERGEGVQRKLSTRKNFAHPVLSLLLLLFLLLFFFTRFEENLRRNGEETVPTAGRIKLDSRLDFRQEVVELVYKVPRPRPYYIYVCSSRCLPGWLLHPQNKENERLYIYTVGETFRQLVVANLEEESSS